jgi:ribosomal protein S25
MHQVAKIIDEIQRQAKFSPSVPAKSMGIKTSLSLFYSLV